MKITRKRRNIVFRKLGDAYRAALKLCVDYPELFDPVTETLCSITKLQQAISDMEVEE